MFPVPFLDQTSQIFSETFCTVPKCATIVGCLRGAMLAESAKVQRILAEVKRVVFQRTPAPKFFALLPHKRQELVTQATSGIDECRRENFRLWAERFEIGVSAAQRVHANLTEKEVSSIRESFLRCEMDKELAVATQPASAGPYWSATKAAVKAGPSGFPTKVGSTRIYPTHR